MEFVSWDDVTIPMVPVTTNQLCTLLYHYFTLLYTIIHFYYYYHKTHITYSNHQQQNSHLCPICKANFCDILKHQSCHGRSEGLALCT